MVIREDMVDGRKGRTQRNSNTSFTLQILRSLFLNSPRHLFFATSFLHQPTCAMTALPTTPRDVSASRAFPFPRLTPVAMSQHHKTSAEDCHLESDTMFRPSSQAAGVQPDSQRQDLRRVQDGEPHLEAVQPRPRRQAR